MGATTRKIIALDLSESDFERFEFLVGNIKERAGGLAVVMAQAASELEAKGVKPAFAGEDPASPAAVARMTAAALALASLVVMGVQLVDVPTNGNGNGEKP
jgi:hypothetical protein